MKIWIHICMHFLFTCSHVECLQDRVQQFLTIHPLTVLIEMIWTTHLHAWHTKSMPNVNAFWYIAGSAVLPNMCFPCHSMISLICSDQSQVSWLHWVATDTPQYAAQVSNHSVIIKNTHISIACSMQATTKWWYAITIAYNYMYTKWYIHIFLYTHD